MTYRPIPQYHPVKRARFQSRCREQRTAERIAAAMEGLNASMQAILDDIRRPGMLAPEDYDVKPVGVPRDD